MVSLATSRLLLRPWVEADIELFVALCGDPKVMRFIGDGQPISAARAKKRFKEFPDEWAKLGYGLFAVERTVDHQFVGFAGLSTPDVLPQLLPATEIGWRIRSRFWGQGYGTEASQAVADWAFAKLGRQRLIAIIREDNKASVRIAEKLNMSLTHTISDERYRRLLEVYELEVTAWRDSVDN